MPEFNDIDLSQVAQRVSAARARIGLSQTTLAKAAGVSQPTVSRIESGARGISLMDADRLASALGLPLDRLLYGSRVADRVLVSLRVDADTHARQAIEAGVELLELDERLDEIVDDHRQRMRTVDVPRPSGPGSRSAAAGRALAEALRDRLALGTAPIFDLPGLIEELTGVDVATLPLPDDVSGMCLVDEERSTTVVLANSTHPAERQRFTLAHELGHLLLADGAHVDTSHDKASPKETRVNEFARCLLVPADGLREWLLRSRDGDLESPVAEEQLSLLSRHFAVSSTVVSIQLQKENYSVPAGQVEGTPLLASRYGWRTEYNAAQLAAAGPKPPTRLVRRTQAAYSAGKLGARVLASLLHRPEAELVAELNDSGITPASPTRMQADLSALFPLPGAAPGARA